MQPFASTQKTKKKHLLVAATLLASASQANAFTTPMAQRTIARTVSSRLPDSSAAFPVASTGLRMRDLDQDEGKRSLKNPTPIVASFFQDNFGLEKAAVPAALLAVLLTMAPLQADAAMSGGRMGGSYSSPRSSYSRSMPSRSSYGGGYYGGGYRSRPNVIVAPTITPYYNPFYSPFYSPFASPFGGAGVMTYRTGGFGFGLGNLVALGFGAFALTTILPGILAASRIGSSFTGFDGPETSALGPGTTVSQISVALQVPNRDSPNSILNALDRLSQTARTNSRVGLQQLTSQVALELLRRKSSIASASTRSNHFRSREQAQRDYNQVSIRERSKFEQETVSKYGGVDYSSRSGGSAVTGLEKDAATMAVVTLVFAIDGDSTKLPTINSVSDVEEALRLIASDAKVDDCLQSVEILWTPEDRSETLSPRDVIADYPELRSV